MYKFCLNLFLFCHFFSFGQSTLKTNLNQIMINEEFDSVSNYWPIETNDDNFFVFDEGEYFMNRAKDQPFAVMLNYNNTLDTFSIYSSMMLGPTENINQSIGIIFRASKNGQVAFIFEVNKFRRFRIRKIINKENIIISNEGKDGWIKNEKIKGINYFNTLNIRSNGQEHDFFINNDYVYSFKLDSINVGNFGIYIGPKTKAKIDYYKIYTHELYRDKSKIYLSDSEIKKLINENKYLTKQLELSLDAKTLEYQNAIKILENQINNLNKINLKLDNENINYAVIKNAIDTNQLDILINLSKKVISKTLENRQLQIEKKLFKDSLIKLKNEYENFEIELLNKVIEKKIHEEQFIDSILNKYCVIDSNFNKNINSLSDTINRNHKPIKNEY